MYQKMLVPLDGSKLAEVVFTYVKELAARLDLDILLLHVVSPEDDEFLPMHQAYVERAAEMLEEQSAQARQTTDGKKIKVEAQLVVGVAAEQISEVAEKQKADFILLASHARSGLRHWSTGGVIDKVLRSARVPIWLVRAGIPDEIVYDKWPKVSILVPLDGSELAEAVLPHAEIIARQRGTTRVEVVLIRVCEPPALTPYSVPEFSGVPLNWGEYIQEQTIKCQEIGRQYLAGIEQRFREKQINVRSEVLVGKAADELVSYINKNPFNLIVMATHGRSGFGRWVYGSVAESVLLGVSSPIFLVKPKT